MTEQCPECDGDAEHVDENHALNAIYDHRDDYAQCEDCGHIFAYRGVADDEAAGFAFYDVEKGIGAMRPTCPEHGRPMVPTKHWPSEETVQFKCDHADPDEDACQRIAVSDLKPAEEVTHA